MAKSKQAKKTVAIAVSPPKLVSKRPTNIAIDDFVMTISDDDEDIPDLDEDEELSSSDEVERAISEEPEPAARKDKKRKRALAAAPERKAGKVDAGGLDSDFEFQTGDAGGVEEYDGWGFEGAHAAMKNQKKGVDIDEIIRRRHLKQQKESGSPPEGEGEAEGQNDGSDDAEDEDEGDNEGSEDEIDASEMQFEFADDDEDAPDDGFGMGADSDEEADGDGEGGEKIPKEAGSDQEDKEAGSGSDADSDAESVASAVPHPEDDEDVSEAEDSEKDDAEEEARKDAYFAPDEGNAMSSDPTVNFQNMNLSRPILRGLANVGFTTPTLIQQKTIPVALLGKDVVGGAQTGSGKTAAFVVPILERLLYRPKKVATTRVLILCPTRELAMQAHSVAVKLAAFTDIKFALAVGGLSLNVQAQELKQRPDVVIATPGRFIDHMRNSQGFTVETIEIIVMDEADRMLEDGFADELNEIINTIPKQRQTMLFSATMTDSVDRLVRLSLQRPVRLLVDAKKSTVKTLIQEFVRIRPQRLEHRLAMLVHLCKELATTRCIVFFRSKVFAHRVRVVFSLFGIKAAELHGSLTQEQRVRAVEDFRDGKIDILLATDLASRGLDIKGVDVVINYEAPQSHEIYLHRVGRTARAGRSGRAITLAAESDRKVVKAAVRAAQSQSAKVVSRVLDNDVVNALHDQLVAMEDEIEEVLKEEQDEKEIQQMEMQVRRSENIFKHEDEIKARPKRTWFETQREKELSKKVSRAELNGVVLPPAKVGKLSGKKRKREESQQEKGYKKTKTDRIELSGRGAKTGADKGKAKMKRALEMPKSKTKPKQKKRR